MLIIITANCVIKKVFASHFFKTHTWLIVILYDQLWRYRFNTAENKKSLPCGNNDNNNEIPKIRNNKVHCRGMNVMHEWLFAFHFQHVKSWNVRSIKSELNKQRQLTTWVRTIQFYSMCVCVKWQIQGFNDTVHVWVCSTHTLFIFEYVSKYSSVNGINLQQKLLSFSFIHACMLCCYMLRIMLCYAIL
jgi:hypothetical protein